MKRDEGGTYHAFAQHDDLGGRFAGAFGPTVVIGQSATHAVAAGKRDPVPDEPPLSPFENPGFDPQLMTTEGSTGPAEAPASSPVQLSTAGSSFRRRRV
jgi:hypothetical protein